MATECSETVLATACYFCTPQPYSCESHFNTNPPQLYVGFSNCVFLPDLPGRNLHLIRYPPPRAVSPTNTITLQQRRLAWLRYTAEFGTLLLLCWLTRFIHFGLHVYLQWKWKGGRMCLWQQRAAEDHGYCAVWSVAPSCWNPTGTFR